MAGHGELTAGAPAGDVGAVGTRATGREPGHVLPAFLLAAGLAYATVAQGGFHPQQLRLLTLLLVGAAAALFWSRSPGASFLRLPPVVASMALAAWSVVSAVAAGDLSGALLPIELLASLVSVLAVVTCLDAWGRRFLLAVVLAVGATVAATGWIGVVARIRPWALVDGGLWRAASTITYANAAAAVLGVVALVAFARLGAAAEPGSAQLWRGGAFIALVGLGATASRAGIASFALGLVALASMQGVRRLMGVAWPVMAGASVAVVALVPGMPADSSPQPAVAVGGLVAGAVLALAAERAGRRTVGGVGVGLVALGGVALAFGAFTLPGGVGGRASVDSPDRALEWGAAVRLASAHPWTGVGPGRPVFTWTDGDGTRRAVAFAHDEPLQVAAAQGVVGMILVVGGLVVTGVWAISAARRLPHAQRWVGACTVPGGVAIATQGLFDFTWHVPLIPVLGTALLGLMVPGTILGRSSRPMERQAECDANDS